MATDPFNKTDPEDTEPGNERKPDRERETINPDHYPRGDLPKLTAERIRFLQQNRLSEEDCDQAISERDRILRKIPWAIEQEARGDRVQSAMATMAAISPPIDELSRKGVRYSEVQSQIAKKPRGKVSDDGETIGTIIEGLARSCEHENETAAELWPHFYSELDRLKLAPEEIGHPTDDKKSKIEYDFRGARKSITLGQFANNVSESRR